MEWFSFPAGSEILHLFSLHGIPTEEFVLSAGSSRRCQVSRGWLWAPRCIKDFFIRKKQNKQLLDTLSSKKEILASGEVTTNSKLFPFLFQELSISWFANPLLKSISFQVFAFEVQTFTMKFSVSVAVFS